MLCFLTAGEPNNERAYSPGFGEFHESEKRNFRLFHRFNELAFAIKTTAYCRHRSMDRGIFYRGLIRGIIVEFVAATRYLERLTKRSEQSSDGCGQRGGTGVYGWYMPIPSTGRARLAAAQSFY